MISDVLVAAEPGSRIVGEELSPEVVRDGLVWIVDPLDGTTNFLHGFPAYAVSIAAAVDGELEAAVVVQVPRHEIYTAARGAGAWQGDRRLAVSAITDPEFALIGTGFPFKETSRLGEYLAQFARVAARTSGIRRPGSAALDLADVAAGRFDGFWELHLSAWDIAAGILLDPRGRRRGHRLRGPAHRGRAHRARGGQSGDARVAAGDGERVIRGGATVSG